MASGILSIFLCFSGLELVYPLLCFMGLLVLQFDCYSFCVTCERVLNLLSLGSVLTGHSGGGWAVVNKVYSAVSTQSDHCAKE